ncbi:hypothetical protein GNF72_17610, partial [Clostridium perfringens]|nr:hypothetical protein [Clostridium perfringens]
MKSNKISNIKPLSGLTKLGYFDISDQEINLSELESNASVEMDNILVGMNGEVIQPSEISSGGNYNPETNRIKWNNISKDVVENYYFAKDIETGNIHGTFSGSVSQPIKYINNSKGNTD